MENLGGHLNSRRRKGASPSPTLIFMTFLVIGLGYGWAEYLRAFLSYDLYLWALTKNGVVFLGSLAIWTTVYLLLLRKSSSFAFWQAVDHEFSHVLGGISSRCRIENLTASASGWGSVTTDRRTFWCAQFPYMLTLPMLAFSLAVLASDVQQSWWLAALAGTLIGYHLFTVVSAWRNDKTDIVRGDRFFRWVWSSATSMLWAGISVGAAWQGSAGVKAFLSHSWANTLMLVQSFT